MACGAASCTGVLQVRVGIHVTIKLARVSLSATFERRYLACNYQQQSTLESHGNSQLESTSFVRVK